MIILTIRTDKEEAEIGLYKDHEQLAYITWQAHRQLAETIHQKIEEMLNQSSISLDKVEGIACFKGPGSFTGLRIGLSVANALAYALDIPVVAKSKKDWLASSTTALLAGKNDYIATPAYDRPAAVSPKN
jgi:tRNA threonylcarbamoyladenosine biosynthesis protein TsaB